MTDTDTDPLDDVTTDDHPDEAFPAADGGNTAESKAENTHSPDANPGGSGAVSGPQAEAYDPLELYDLQRHRNGDETALLLCSFGGGYQVLALDVDAGGQLLEVEEVGGTPERDKAVGMAEYWLDQHPDGVLGAAAGDGGGILSKLGIGGDGA